MKAVIMLVLIYSKICNCLYHQQRVYETSYNEIKPQRIENYPWIVIVSKISTQEILSFGSLIHASAVLTHASLDAHSLYFDFKVLGKCFFHHNDLTSMSSYQCAKERNIKEYSIIEVEPQGDNNYWQNAAVLILSEPFTLIPNVNIIPLARDPSDFNPHLCNILYLMLLSNSNLPENPTFEFPTQIEHEGNYSTVKINWFHLQNTYLNYVNSLDLPGNPVVCLTKHSGGHWVLTFLLHTSIKKVNADTLYSTSAMLDITYYHKAGIIDTIIRNAGFSI
ncbi:uncharacterized protein [Chelonus insularis]|uniref:uncharacterized protein n=1 Tax=Chelonus insularis TaxID=460826 RepID=UPI00158B8275|nr:uncharacterized protein LOC118072057 [Chelonus insularis]